MGKKTYGVDIVAGLVLFCIFTTCMLFVLLSGAKSYKSISHSIEEQYAERTCLSYITAKIRHFDNGGVYLTNFEGVNALALDEEIEGNIYTTLIYPYNGYICELFAAKDSGLLPEDGLSIIAADNLSFEQAENSLFHITCEADGRKADAFVTVRSERSDRA